MAEGGYDPMDETTDKDPLIPKKGDDNDDDDDGDDLWKNINWEAPVDVDPEDLEPEPEKRNPFEPAASSTPSDSEHIALKTRLSPEKQGTSDETSFSTGFNQGVTNHDSMVRSELENEFPNMSLTEIEF